VKEKKVSKRSSFGLEQNVVHVPELCDFFWPDEARVREGQRETHLYYSVVSDRR
jgi:hypothetical protein